ncbi:MAG: hypothetical protein ABIJ73_02220, partial [Pseudomonadota bacterium]
MWRYRVGFGDNRAMSARILDGKGIADTLLDDLARRVKARLAAGTAAPGLAVVDDGDGSVT